ncbi:accessory gene regulator ArgB-like protein [Maledivibacter halophilus]|uniref:Accessory gene regulator B n=1 Tax=Maledivibacter halophilus TaxID=36842 RepID=A0A1T5M4Q6_9FIRM|nr:accessory gene regulator B family protein [Maledivibacter halophilus]SKC83237.1 accessory gene regulator B [Maledivibacter halophilus]
MSKFGIEESIDKIINYFKNNVEIDEDQEAILTYSMHLVFSGILSIGFALLAGLLLGIVPYVLTILITNVIFRTFSGGAHSEGMVSCATYGAVIMSILGMIVKFTYLDKNLLAIILFFILIFAFWSINKYAPADTPGKPITTKVKRDKLRKLSFSALFIWCLIGILWYTGFVKGYKLIYSSALGLLWQSFSLTNLGYALIHHMDKILQKITKKREGLI